MSNWRNHPYPYYNNRYDMQDQNFQQGRRQYCQAKPSKSRGNNRQSNIQRFPDRWINYDPLGKEISNARFIAFKTPLKQSFFKENDAMRFEVINVISSLRNLESTLGLVIDLTNTDRYYDSQLWSSHGIQYVKLRCPGHEVNKSEQHVQRFIDIVSKFFTENPENGKIVGVHCTHGLNRTGYLICRYLIDKCEFEISRGHRIEREAYISSLHNAEKLRDQRLKKEDNDETSVNDDGSPIARVVRSSDELPNL
uniref:Tyrosine specific protein phosphatases domain-containing protein n=1 Tax=Acrobeloides nanus TaxID=290746 RepID=A0A914CC28_9BILA